MRDTRERTLTTSELNALMDADLKPAVWELVIRRIAYPELRFDRATGTARCPDYVPIEALLEDAVRAVKAGELRAEACAVCGRIEDVDHAPGIFRNPAALAGFICRPCAEAMTAWEFFDRWIQA